MKVLALTEIKAAVPFDRAGSCLSNIAIVSIGILHGVTTGRIEIDKARLESP